MTPHYEHIVILTGSGISAESGLSTFRDADGIWSRYSIDDVATPSAFRRNPALVHDFYNQRRRAAREAQPNEAHKALALLEQDHHGNVWIVTQNVDDLHERAGSQNLIHMHGELMKVRCCDCSHIWNELETSPETICPGCGNAGSTRPHVVWFGEYPLGLNEIAKLLEDCDLFMSIGTSGQVYPAAGFVDTVRQYGRAHLVELNLEPSFGESLFTERHYGRAGEIVPRYVKALLENSLQKGQPMENRQ